MSPSFWRCEAKAKPRLCMRWHPAFGQRVWFCIGLGSDGKAFDSVGGSWADAYNAWKAKQQPKRYYTRGVIAAEAMAGIWIPYEQWPTEPDDERPGAVSLVPSHTLFSHTLWERLRGWLKRA